MLALTLNPGFVPILAGLLTLVTPARFRAALMGGSALFALWLLLDYEFGAASAMAQMGLPVVFLDLDELNRIFGIALLIALAVVSIYTRGRKHVAEDAAILIMAGAAVTALFVGDLVSFVAASALSALGAAWIVFASPLEGARETGVRLLMWNGLEGLLFLIGVALRLSAGAQGSVLAHLDAEGIAGGFILAAILIRLGAPLAHVWQKDAIAHASPAGGAALSVFTTILGVYGLARFFPAEALLVPIGMAMIVIGGFYAAAEQDLRRAAAAAMTAQWGVCVALLGVGAPVAVAAAEAAAFAAVISFLGMQMALGNVQERLGATTLTAYRGAAGVMPIGVTLTFFGGLAVAGAPGFIAYATQTLTLEATATWELRGLWALISAMSAVSFVTLGVRPLLVANHAAEIRPAPTQFTYMLGALVALFICLAVGLAPGWLFGLLPGQVSFAPFELALMAHQLQTLGAAGLIYVVLGLTIGAERLPPRVLDIDALYTGPLAGAGNWLGIVALRIQGAAEALAGRLLRAGERAGAQTVAAFDRPYAPWLGAAGAWAVIVLAVIGALIAQRLPE